MNYLPVVAPVAEEEGGEDYKENGGGHLEEEGEEKNKIWFKNWKQTFVMFCFFLEFLQNQ